jgi:hypothetical protein
MTRINTGNCLFWLMVCTRLLPLIFVEGDVFENYASKIPE